ncbi:MAG: hypothetical protein PHD21_06220 [Flavobacteriales bacterium]|nr:hypothetical protein [Flavobacteriales bacterium]
MNKVNETFDNIMRGAFAGIGTSQSFTRRLMIRIEKEKEMARVAKVARISNRIAFCVLIAALVALMIALTIVSNMDVNPNVFQNIKDSISEFFASSYQTSQWQAYPPMFIFKVVSVVLAIVAVLSLDKVLKKEFSRNK